MVLNLLLVEVNLIHQLVDVRLLVVDIVTQHQIPMQPLVVVLEMLLVQIEELLVEVIVILQVVINQQ